MKRNKLSRIVLPAIILVLLSVKLPAQSIAGDWYSMMKVQGIHMQLQLHIQESATGLTGSFSVPEQGAMNIPLSSVSLENQEFAFTFIPAGFSFEGISDPAFSVIIGYFSQGDIDLKTRFHREPVDPPAESTAAIKEIYDKEEFYIEMRDGIRLFTSVYSPKESDEKSPILLFRTPYNAEGMGEEGFNYFVSIYHRFIKEGYILAFQDVRGRYMSEGDFVNVRPFIPKKKRSQVDEASDTWDTVEWLINNVKDNNGRVGVTGISYPGFYATMAILAGHPAIKAVSPQAPVTDWFLGDDWHHNGAFFLIDGFSFYTSFGDPHPGESRRNYPLNFSWGTEDSYDYFLNMGPIKNTRKIFPDSVRYWHEIFEHPDYDDWWKATVPLPHLKKVKPAVMTVGGWFDAEDLYGTLNTYKAIEEQNKESLSNFLVMGPWAHGQWGAEEAENLGNIYWGMATNEMFHELEVDFFNYYLKDEGEGDFSEAYIYMTGENQWKEYNDWPPADAAEKTIYLQPGGGISFTPPSVSDSFSEYISDPDKPVPYMEDVHLRRDPAYMIDDQRFASRRPDVLVYQTDVLTEDLTLTGPVSADLYVSTTGTDADFIVKIIDVFPNQVAPPAGADIDVPLGAYQMLVRGEVMRGKYRNSFEYPEPFVPGEITKVSFSIPDLAHKFRKGHKLMIQVQSSWFPLVDRNPQKFVNIYECDEDDFRKATIRLYHDREHASGVKVMLSEE
ncbi:MAG: CocE/NonD family hydrolase [Bacteroidales bacterium]|nr:CocE/NonD family hydrolase [Bacteroidales bacterium]